MQGKSCETSMTFGHLLMFCFNQGMNQCIGGCGHLRLTGWPYDVWCSVGVYDTME